MSFEDHVKDFGLVQEENVNTPKVDFSKLECTLSKGTVYINRAVVDTMKLKETDGLAVHIGTQEGAVVFGLTVYRGDPKHTLKPHILKTKPTRINIVALMHKHYLRTDIDYKIDLIDVGEYYLVFAILEEEKTAPLGEAQTETMGRGETVPEWSDF